MKAWYVMKAGRISSGWGFDGGKINHIIIAEDAPYAGSQDNALCGTYPAVSWNHQSHEKPIGRVCTRCLRKLQRDERELTG